MNDRAVKKLIFVFICSYTPVYDFVSSFLTKAEERDARAGAIMSLGAAEEFVGHFQVSGYA